MAIDETKINSATDIAAMLADLEPSDQSSAEWVAIDSVMLDPANVRRHPERNMAAIKASIQKFGQRKPIVVGVHDKIIQAGNGTWQAMKDLGWTQVWVAWSPLTRAEAAAYAITDNRSGDLAEWDEAALLAQMEGLRADGWTLDAFGWNEKDWKTLEQNVRPREKLTDDDIAAKTLAELRARWDVRPGQLWYIPSETTPGRYHRVYCGDATKSEDVEQLLVGGMVAGVRDDVRENRALIVTSPPYWTGQPYDNHDGSGSAKEFMRRIAAAWANVVTRRIIIQTGHTSTTLIGDKGPVRKLLLDSWWQEAWEAHGWLLRHRRVWIKNTAVGSMKRDGLPPSPDSDIIDEGWEVLLTFYRPAKGQPGQERVAANWAQMGHWSDVPSKDQVAGHPCPYPVELPARCIELYSKAGDVVIDMFLGAGTTIVAAERTGRLCYGMELSPEYVAVTLNRCMDLGMQPVQAEV